MVEVVPIDKKGEYLLDVDLFFVIEEHLETDVLE